MRTVALVTLLASTLLAPAASAQDTPPAAREGEPKSDLPKWDPAAGKFTEIISNLDGVHGLIRLWKDEKGREIMAELPKDIDKKLLFLAFTVSSGIPNAGVQFGDMYGSFKRIDKQLAFIQPNLAVRTTGDEESKLGRQRVFTDRVAFKAPIEGVGPDGGLVINLTSLFGRNAGAFFGGAVAGADPSLLEVAKAKGFPRNIELAYRMPLQGGNLGTVHYSLSEIPEDTGYTPRVADERVGYFTTAYLDVGHPSQEDPYVRFVNRWRLEKADPNLALSPPKEPIVFYIEHTTPIRYRRWVRDGILAWNKAFQAVGIDGAIQVYQQDARTGAHMEKDPEDARYNFMLWTNANMGFAIGPSRVHPKTGQILDADIVMDEGFVWSYARAWDLMPEIVGSAYDDATRRWLLENPQWDPRLRLADPERRGELAARIAAEFARPTEDTAPQLLGDAAADGLAGRLSQLNGYCDCGRAKSIDLALARMAPAIVLGVDDGKGDAGAPENPNRPGYIDGLPEEFVGPMVRDVIMHEVGHTLGLRHNFKGSALRSVEEMNSAEKPLLSNSVMDYLPININGGDGPVQGAWGMMDIGPYDMWAIEYGYTGEKDLAPILSRVNEPEHAYGSDEDTMGPDPLARRFDLGRDPLDWADGQVALVAELRPQILQRIVKEGDAWPRARRAWDTLLSKQVSALRVASDWVGGAHVARNHKGDPGQVAPVRPVDPQAQRRALSFVIDNAFVDSAYGLSPELLSHLAVGRWFDDGGMRDISAPPAWPVHERVLAVQSMALTALLNPGTISRVGDNEVMLDGGADALTIPELLGTVRKAVWSEVIEPPSGDWTERTPLVSSMRRNLQREWVDRMIGMSVPGRFRGSAAASAATLARAELATAKADIDETIASENLDAYTKAHLSDASARIAKALDPMFVHGQ